MIQINPDNPNRILRLREVIQTVGLGRSSVYRLIHKGMFPRPIKLSERAVGWNAGAVSDWLAERQQSLNKQ